MNLLRWFNGGDDLMDVSHDTRWAWVTLGLQRAAGGGLWRHRGQLVLPGKAVAICRSDAALTRLRNLCICCALCGGIFYALDLRWAIWRIYDLVLLVLVFRTWLFVSKMPGLSLVNARLAQLKELETSAARYREIAELLPHMVWTADSEGFVDFCNQRWREYVGDNRTWLDALHPEDYTQAFACWSNAVASRRPLAIEARLGGPQAYRAFVVKATPIVKGDIVKWLGACADIEDQKLLATQKELQAKQRGFFLNALSHDLRAPLNNIVLNAHLLTLGVHEPAEMESIEMIRENALAAADLVTKLLDFAKVGARTRIAWKTFSWRRSCANSNAASRRSPNKRDCICALSMMAMQRYGLTAKSSNASSAISWTMQSSTPHEAVLRLKCKQRIRKSRFAFPTRGLAFHKTTFLICSTSFTR